MTTLSPSRVLSVALLAGCALAAAARDYPNLLYNPSFEQLVRIIEPGARRGRDREYRRFVLHWQGRRAMQVDPSVAHSGKVSVRLEGPADGYTFHKASETGGSVCLVPGTRYVLSAWVKTKNVTGKGVSLWFAQAAPKSRLLVQSQWVNGTADWAHVQATFETPAGHVAGWLRLQWKLNEGDVAWIDDLRLAPESGKVEPAPPPEMVPRGGRSEGPVHVTLRTRLPGAEVRYTIDGAEPTVRSKLYVHPFRLAGHATVKARVFHVGHRDSEIVSAAFTLKPRTDGGVPFYPIGYDYDVEAWWAGHVYNRVSPIHVDAIRSPEPRINVADVREKHPGSATAGIEEALAMLPPEGGTLWFPKDRGPYIVHKKPTRAKNYYFLASQIMVLRRSNIHFLSDGAVIRSEARWEGTESPSGNVAGMFTFCSMDFADRQVKEKPSTNFYFKNIVFDGLGKAPGAVVFRHCSTVLFDDCVFRAFEPSARGHPGLISAASVVDNLWCRNCRFEKGKFGVYWDGVHNAGFVRCHFGKGLAQGGALMMTNNDMARLSAAERNCQYIVIADCTFEGPGRAAVILTNANTLVTRNVVKGPYRTFVSQTGRGRSNILYHLRYNGAGIKVVGNTVENIGTLLELRGDCAQHTRRHLRMETVVRANVARGTDCLLSWNPAFDLHFPPYAELGGVRVCDNQVSGRNLPQVRLPRSELDRVAGIRIVGNKLSGELRELLVDLEGRPLHTDSVEVRNNQINPRK